MGVKQLASSSIARDRFRLKSSRVQLLMAAGVFGAEQPGHAT
jgi:hypothetical protein